MKKKLRKTLDVVGIRATIHYSLNETKGKKMNNLLKSLMVMTAVVAFSGTSATQASVIIDGQEFPDGCKRIEKEVNGLQTWGISCPKGADRRQYEAYIERQKHRQAPSFGGWASGDDVKRQAPIQQYVKCKAATREFHETLAINLEWFHQTLYGPAHKRVFTARAITSVRDRLRSWGMGVMERGKSIFRHRKRGEDGDGLCTTYIENAHIELNRVVTLLRREAAKGNRDLIGTGLNPHESQYNN